MENNNGCVIGIDTSCYTTSLALVDKRKNLLWEKRIVLDVPLGQRGLAQSEGFFKHVSNMPLLFADLQKHLSGKQIKAVAASVRPRPVENSYLPVFRVGESQGRSLAAVLSVPFVEVSHQEGHLAVGLWSAGLQLPKPFLAIHISGGTTELLLVKEPERKDNFFQIDILGSSLDLHAGQLVDRVGVALGMSFPAGKDLEALANQGEAGKEVLPSAVRGYNLSFSGAETKALRLIEAGSKAADVALAVLQCLANSLEKIIRKAILQYQISQVLLVGGVAANQYLRQRLSKRLEHPGVGVKLHFAKPQFSSDNAVGTALLGLQARDDVI
mgnify:CR=1 FL=1